MTERERVAATYAKAQKRYPNAVTNELVLGLEQRRTIGIAMAFLWSGILCAVLFFLTGDIDVLGPLKAGSFCFYIFAAFEYFRTILNASKIKAHYGFDPGPVSQKLLTYRQLSSDIRHGAQNIRLVTATLYDKDDRDTSDISMIFHKYNLFFRMGNTVSATAFRVKRSEYVKAPLNAPYILVLSGDGTVLGAYMAAQWSIAADLFALCDFDAAAHNAFFANRYTPAPSGAAKKSTIAWDVLILLVQLLAFVLPILPDLLCMPITTFFATRRAVRNRSFLSVFNAFFGYLEFTFLIIALFMILA